MIVELTTTDVAHGGYCVARHNGMVVFVSGALPQEKVAVEITDQRSRQWYGRVVDVLDASPDRVPHVWPLAQRTGVGGADLGYVSLEAGRRWKAHVIETQLSRLAHVTRSVNVEAVPTDEANQGLGWRTRVSFHVDDAGQLGMHAAKSHDIVRVDDMPLAVPEIQQRLSQMIEAGGAPKIAGGKATFVQASGSSLVTVLSGPGSTRGHDRPGAGTARPADRSRYVVEVVQTRFGTWTYHVAADGFWQVHREAPSTLVTAVLEAVGDVTGPVWDLYAGAGLFTVPLADRLSVPVTAVESSRVGAEYLRHNTAGRSVNVMSSDVVKALSWAKPIAHQVVVCDPPRAGAGKAAVSQMARLAPDAIVYIACDPAALARDIGLFARFGYTLASLRAFDLFPLTHHVECVAQLVRR